MRIKWLAAAAVVVSCVLLVPASASAVATAPSSSAWSGYATASTLHVNAIQTAAAGPLVANTSVAFSGASVNSMGQSSAITNELGLGVQAVKGDREAYGRGSGFEVGAGKSLPNNPNTNQVIQPAMVEAGASPVDPATGAPNPYQTALQSKEVLKQSVSPAAFAGVVRGQALATWHDRYVLPMLGSPLGFGLGYADDVQLLNTGSTTADGAFTGAVISTDTTATSGERTTSQSWSTNYLVNNGDGTCGLASETRQTIAPLRLNLPPDTNPANDVTIEALGEWRMIAVATGKPGGSKIEYAPPSGGPSVPLLRVIQNNVVTNVLTTDQFFGAGGLTLPSSLQPVISLAVGEDPRAIAAPTADPDPASKPTVTDTQVSGAVDVIRLRLLQPNAPAAGVNALDLRLGHMEVKSTVPAGGINCEIPVTKTASPDVASPGGDITFTITIPAEDLTPFPCEMTAIHVEDVVGIEEGAPRFAVTGGTGPAGQKGVVSGNTVTFENIGSWKPGDPLLKVTITVRLAQNSPAGKLKDDVRVLATPSNCKARDDAVGRALGGDSFFGASSTRLTGGAVTGGGSATNSLRGATSLSGPTIVAELPKTGPSMPPAVPIAAAGVLLGLAGLSYVRRRASTN